MRKISDIKTVEEYNPKIDERFIRYISPQRPFTYEEVKEDKSKYKSLLKAFKEIKLKELTIDRVTKMYQILENHNTVQISEEFIDEFSGMDTVEKMITGFIKLIQEKTFLESTVEMTIMIFNCQMIKQKYCPIVFYPNITKQLVEAIESSESQNKIYAQFHHAYFNTINKLNRRHNTKSQEEIINLILNHQHMLKDLYKIESFGLFGSFARGDQNEYSDIDVWIKVYGWISYQTKYLIRSLLEAILDLGVDINFWTPNHARTVFHDSLKIY